MDKVAARKGAHRVKRMAKRKEQYALHRFAAYSGEGSDWKKCFRSRPR